METNIEHLHAVVDGVVTGRQCGKTTARCHEIAGMIEVGFSTVYAVITEYRDLSYIETMLNGILSEHHITMNRGLDRYTYSACGELIVFILASRVEDQFLSYSSSGVIVPIGHYD